MLGANPSQCTIYLRGQTGYGTDLLSLRLQVRVLDLQPNALITKMVYVLAFQARYVGSIPTQRAMTLSLGSNPSEGANLFNSFNLLKVFIEVTCL